MPPELVRQVRQLVPIPRVELLRSEAGILLDRLAVRVARGRGALDVRLGRVLAALADGDRLLQLGYSSLGAYARAELGVSATVAQDLARVARGLRTRPVLRAAVEAGVVSCRKAQVVLPVTGRDPQSEARWVERARSSTVRALTAQVAAATGDAHTAAEADAGVRWARFSVTVPTAARPVVERALDVARRVLGGGARPWECLEALCQEYLSSHPEVAPPPRKEMELWLPRDMVESVEMYFEKTFAPWPFLHQHAEAVPAAPDPVLTNAFELHRLALRLTRARDGWDELMGHLTMLIRMYGLWRDMQFASFGHYCRERLGLGPSAVAQRASLERRLYDAPSLREAIAAGRINYTKALLLSRLHLEEGPGVRAEIAWAERHTCQEVQARVEKILEARQDGLPPLAPVGPVGDPDRYVPEGPARGAGSEVEEGPSSRCEPLGDDPAGAGVGRGRADDQRPGGHGADESVPKGSTGSRWFLPEDAFQMCGARTMLTLVPAPALAVIKDAIEVATRVAQAAGGRRPSPGEALVIIATEFLAAWDRVAPRRRGFRRHPARRSKGICEVPECVRAASHVHHVTYRSHQGGDEASNTVDLCAAHHLRSIHGGWMRVRRRGDELVWDLGVRNGVPMRTVVTWAPVDGGG